MEYMLVSRRVSIESLFVLVCLDAARCRRSSSGEARRAGDVPPPS